MSAAVMYGSQESWGRASPAVMSSYRTTSPIVGVKDRSGKKLDRPKSVPPSLKTHLSHTQHGRPRPKTAFVVTKQDCERVAAVEHEAVRKHNLEAHLPTRKVKTPPWQHRLDEAPVPIMVTPSYTLAKSRSKVEMHIRTDDFFEPPPDTPSMRREDPERDSLIKQLQQQIDDLNLFLEEERLNHRETRRRAGDQLKDRVDELTRQHENVLQQLSEEREEELDNQTSRYEQIIKDNKKEHHGEIGKMKKEMEYLQGAFESYKSQLHFETEQRWKAKQGELEGQYEADIQAKVQQLRQKIQQEKGAEYARIEKDFKGEILQLKREQKREIDALHRKYANHRADLEKLQETEGLLSDVQDDYARLQKAHDKVCKQMAELTRELTDTKVKLIGFEEHFSEKVQEIDDKYQQQIQELKQDNIGLRRLYRQKCGELLDEKVISEQAFTEKLGSAKETMKFLIETRNRAVVSVAAGNPDLENQHGRQSKERPASAPTTRLEADSAQLSAGETGEFERERAARRPRTAKPRLVQQIEEESREQEEEGTSPRREGGGNMEDILLQVNAGD